MRHIELAYRVPPEADPGAKSQALRKASQALEAVFLAELLKTTDLARSPDAFGGGAGEDQFASFLIDEQAKLMTAAGGIGLAQSIFEALKAKSDV